MSNTQSRKSDHLDLAARGEVGFRQKTNLFECVELVHSALPELSFDDLELETRLFGKVLKAPLLIAGMTGGTEKAGEINRALSTIAEQQGYAFGLGSQRPMLDTPELGASYRVRDWAPNTLVFGNLGVTQATRVETESVEALVSAVGADAMCIHLNPAQELIQESGDRDFRGCEATLGRLVGELSIPVVAKETGAGISRAVAMRLRAAGVSHVDVSGAGGTSWVGVEALRTANARQRDLGEQLWDWGIPTAASVTAAVSQKFQTVIATGGIKNGVEVAKAIALGADLVGIARPVLQAYDRGGAAEAGAFLRRVEQELRAVMLLVGAGNLRQLRQVPRLVHGQLGEWNRLWAA